MTLRPSAVGVWGLECVILNCRDSAQPWANSGVPGCGLGVWVLEGRGLEGCHVREFLLQLPR